jgi:cytochrome c oxidase cbb3-type subunit 3
MSEGLSWYITIVTLANILGMAWLIWWSGKGGSEKVSVGAEMGHTWDGDLREYNNPLPRWWLWLFYVTIVFGLVYLALYPGLGSYVGALGWSQEGSHAAEIEEANALYGPIFEKYAKQDLAVVAQDPQAQRMGQRIYLTYCAMCHGSDAGGATGFPNLTDGDWLYGGEPAAIKTSILQGRNGIMPGFAGALGDQGLDDLTEYVLKLAGREHDAARAQAGEPHWALCAGCHMPNGQGNQALGAPNLTDKVWLYGASRGAIRKSIAEGRNGVMPAQQEFLGEAKSHLVAAYVYGLSKGGNQRPE